MQKNLENHLKENDIATIKCEEPIANFKREIDDLSVTKPGVYWEYKQQEYKNKLLFCLGEWFTEMDEELEHFYYIYMINFIT